MSNKNQLKSLQNLKNNWKDVSFVDGEFTFKLTEEKKVLPDKFEETVTNKDGKATFSKLTFTKAGTYKYKITEQKVLIQTLTTMQ